MRSPNPIGNPQFLPGGKSFLYFQCDSDDAKHGFWVGSFDGKPPVFLGRGFGRAVYDAASGMLLYIDPLGLEGDPVVVAERVRMINADWHAEFSASGNGSLCFAPARVSENRRFEWLDRAGKLIETLGQPSGVIGSFDLSRDEKRLVFGADPAAQPTVWALNLTGGSAVGLTVKDSGIIPRFSSDGKSVFYTHVREIRRQAADGLGEAQTVGIGNTATSVSPDGKFLLLVGGDIEVLPLTGEPKKQPYLVTPFREASAAFSADGRIRTNRGGVRLMCRAFRSSGGSAWCRPGPVWRSDGREIYWTRPEGMLVAAGMELQPESVRAASGGCGCDFGAAGDRDDGAGCYGR